MAKYQLLQTDLHNHFKAKGYTIDKSKISRYLKYGNVMSGLTEVEILMIANYLNITISVDIKLKDSPEPNTKQLARIVSWGKQSVGACKISNVNSRSFPSKTSWEQVSKK